MKDFRMLLTVQLKQAFRRKKGAIKTKTKIGFALLMLVVGVFVLFVLSLFVIGFYTMGKDAAAIGAATDFLTCIFGIVQAIVLLYGMATVFSTIYFSKDNEMLLSYPVKPQIIFASKLTVVYVYEFIGNAVTSLLAVIPFVIGARLPFSIGLVLCFFILPALPLFLATVFAIPIMFLSSFFKKRSTFATLGLIVIAVVLFLGYMLIVNGFGSSGEADDATLLAALAAQASAIANVLLPDKFLALSMVGGSFGTAALNFLYALLIDVGLFVLAYLVSSAVYKRSISRQLETPKSASSHAGHYGTGNKVLMLMKKDFKEIIRYPAMAFYCLYELIIGPAMMIFMSVVLSSATDAELVEGGYTLMDLMNAMPHNVALILICISMFLVFSLNYAAITAFTRENKNFYHVKYLPVHYSQLVDSKALLPFLLNEAALFIIDVIALFAMRFPLLSVAIAFAVCSSLNGAFCYMQVYLDMRKPRLGYENVAQGFKNNAAGYISILVAIAAIGVIVGLYFLISLAEIDILRYIYFMVLFAAALGASYCVRNMAIKHAPYFIGNTEP